MRARGLAGGGRWISVAAVITLVLSPASLPAVEASGVSVTLVAQSPVSQAQGLAFDFAVVVDNTGPSRWVDVVQRLRPTAGTSPAVDFVSDFVFVPEGGRVRRQHDIVTAQYFAETGQFEMTPIVDGAPAGTPGLITVTAPTVLPATFQDVTTEAGVGATLPDTNCDGQQSAGAAWGDVDLDGDLDLYVPLPDQPARLFINDGTGRFTDQAASFNVANSGSVGRAAVMADHDNDGDADLYVVNEGNNRLYRNDVSTLGSFTDITASAGLVGEGPALGTSASWGDYDNDGFIDLYVTNYADCVTLVGQDDHLYHNEGDGTFTDQTALLEHGPGCDDGCTSGYGFQAAWLDYDRDQDLDLYLANDFNWMLPFPDENHLWRNDGFDVGSGEWRFTDVTDQARAAPFSLQSMGIAIADTDGDLDPDIAISDILGNDVLRNLGNGTFTEASDIANLDRPWESADVATITWGLGFYDFNLDQWEDLYVASGVIRPGQGSQDPRYNQLFLNTGNGKFADLSTLSGADDGLKGRGVAFADYDRDGRMDMYVVNQEGSPILYRNTTDTTGRHWLEVDPIGTTSNRDGCGASLILTVGTKRLVRTVFCGSVSLGTGNDPYVHFGLGSATTVDRLVIRWPSGTSQVLQNLVVDQAIVLTEPAG